MQNYINLNSTPVNPVEAIKDSFNGLSLQFQSSLTGFANNLRYKASQQRIQAAKTDNQPINTNKDAPKNNQVFALAQYGVRKSNQSQAISASEAIEKLAANQNKTRVQKFNSRTNDLSYRTYQAATTVKNGFISLVSYAKNDTGSFIRRTIIIVGITFVAITYSLSLFKLATPIPMMPRF